MLKLSGIPLKALKVDRKKLTRREEQMEGEQKSEGCNNVRFRFRTGEKSG